MASGPVQRRRDGRVELRLEPAAAEVLRTVFTEVAELIGPPEQAEPDDPLAAALGIGVRTSPPEDPALRRLLPDAYGDDPEAAADFRRFTELGLRERKRAAAATALGTLGDGSGPVLLDLPQAHAWLGALNDARLALGTRLDVDEDWERRMEAARADEVAYQYAVYEFLTDLQELLVRALSS
jgi:Domain of unknown function (DUF2017)